MILNHIQHLITESILSGIGNFIERTFRGFHFKGTHHDLFKVNGAAFDPKGALYSQLEKIKQFKDLAVADKDKIIGDINVIVHGNVDKYFTNNKLNTSKLTETIQDVLHSNSNLMTAPNMNSTMHAVSNMNKSGISSAISDHPLVTAISATGFGIGGTKALTPDKAPQIIEMPPVYIDRNIEGPPVPYAVAAQIPADYNDHNMEYGLTGAGVGAVGAYGMYKYLKHKRDSNGYR